MQAPDDYSFRRQMAALVNNSEAVKRRIAADAMLERAMTAPVIDLDLLKRALARGAAPDRPINGVPPMHIAASQKAFRAFMLLADYGASPADHDATGRTAFDVVAEKGWTAVKAFFTGVRAPAKQPGGVIVTSYQRRMNAVLADAIRAGSTEAVAAALELGADAKGRGMDYPPLHLAVVTGRTDKVDIVLAAGADPDAVNAVGGKAADMIWQMNPVLIFSAVWYKMMDHLKACGLDAPTLRKPEDMSLEDMRKPPAPGQDATVLHLLATAGKFDIVFERMKKFPKERLTADDFLKYSTSLRETVLFGLGRHGKLRDVFSSAVWQGRIEEMSRLWAEAEKNPLFRAQVDFEAVKKAVLDVRRNSFRRKGADGRFHLGKNPPK